MKMTSAEANKKLKQMNDEYAELLAKERQASVFNAAVGEDIESVRPEYDYEATQKRLKKLACDIRRLKHSINVFNTTTVIPDLNLTIDEALVFIPQLNNQKRKYAEMKSRLPKSRVPSYGHSGIIDYAVINYKLEDAELDYDTMSQMLTKLQTALDVVNNTVTFDFAI